MKPFVIIFSDRVPEWAWNMADNDSVRIACYGGYENAIEFY